MRHKIEDFASKLDKLQNTLTLATMLASRASENANNEEVFELLKGLQKDNQDQNLDNEEMLNKLQFLVDMVQRQSEPKLEIIQKRVQECLADMKQVRQRIPQTREMAILRWLSFRQRSWRHEEIPLNYQKTFQWIFQKPAAEDEWDDFTAFLTDANATAPYFINGKAGSGKSTLMKFIVNDARTRQALSQWAGRDELFVMNFFFWNLGTSLQKSHVGMLRALIQDVLERYPELIPVVLPGIYQNWSDTGFMGEPNYVEVKTAFELLIKKSASFLKLCIFIDGVDEFDGDHRDMAQFLRSCSSPQVKLIVSSRPITPCISAFRDCRFLKLQDLTKHDMEIFIRGELISHPAMVELASCFPQDSSELVFEIKSKAQGVFLWVTLVVRLLVDGLEAGDDVNDLRIKLRSLPPDLRDLYHRMLSKMKPEYQVQAAEIFQLLHTWNFHVAEEHSFGLFTLFFATQPPSQAFSRSVGFLNSATLQWITRSTAARLSSRCCGLLEVHENRSRNSMDNVYVPFSREGEPGNYQAVAYLHRTVAEFLQFGEVWNEMCEMTKVGGFDPFVSLASASLSMLKIGSKFDTNSMYVLSYAKITATFCREATNMSGASMSQYVDSIEQTMKGRQVEKGEMIGSNVHWSLHLYAMDTIDRLEYETLFESASIFSFAARMGLIKYLNESYDPTRLDSPNRATSIIYALKSWTEICFRPVPLCYRTDTLLFLLQHDCRPEDKILDERIWEFTRAQVIPKMYNDPEELAQLLAILITNARDPHVIISACQHKYDLKQIARSLRYHHPDFEIKNLGQKMEQLVCRSPEDLQVERQGANG